MLRRRPLVFMIIATAAAACASTPDGAAQELAGCYYFERDDAAQRLQLPWGIQLLPAPLENPPATAARPNTFQAVTLVNEERVAGHPFGYWRLEGDSLEIGYPTGGGLVLDLALIDDGLTGTALPVGDAGFEPRTREPVRLMLARCPE